MEKSVGSGVPWLLSVSLLTLLSGCSSGSLFHSFFSRPGGSSSSDARFQKDYPELKALLRDNHFRKALVWVRDWEKTRTLSEDNQRLLRKDERTIRLVGAAYYMGVARERRKSGRLKGALSALETARALTPEDPTLRTEIEKTKARVIVSGQDGQDWGELLGKLLALKAKNPKDDSLDPTIGWAYGKLSESEYMAGRYSLALGHARKALSYKKTDALALRVRDRVEEMVRTLVDRAEREYRGHQYAMSARDLGKALEVDPESRRARKDWQILSETPGALQNAEARNFK